VPALTAADLVPTPGHPAPLFSAPESASSNNSGSNNSGNSAVGAGLAAPGVGGDIRALLLTQFTSKVPTAVYTDLPPYITVKTHFVSDRKRRLGLQIFTTLDTARRGFLTQADINVFLAANGYPTPCTYIWSRFCPDPEAAVVLATTRSRVSSAPPQSPSASSSTGGPDGQPLVTVGSEGQRVTVNGDGTETVRNVVTPAGLAKFLAEFSVRKIEGMLAKVVAAIAAAAPGGSAHGAAQKGSANTEVRV